MPSRKQRRRRQKERRHDYEYVYVDEEGREVDDAPAPSPATTRAAKGDRARQRGAATQGRKVEPPSWRRVGIRALIFAPLMFLMVALLYQDLTLTTQVLLTLQMLAMFVPLGYLMERFAYRRYLRRTGQAR